MSPRAALCLGLLPAAICFGLLAPRPVAAAGLEVPPPMPAAAPQPMPLEQAPGARGTDGAAGEAGAGARRGAAQTRIEQRRRGNRVVEIVVTPRGATHSYTIVNREGQAPLGAFELSAGLSTPRFLKIEF